MVDHLGTPNFFVLRLWAYHEQQPFALFGALFGPSGYLSARVKS